jgi:pilus assembly protein FimV
VDVSTQEKGMAASEDRNRLDREEQTQDSELEQYGVWVKAGPEDVDENDAEDEAFALTDLGDEELEEAEFDLLAADEQEPDFSATDEISLDLDEPEDTLSIDDTDSEPTDDLAGLEPEEEETLSEVPPEEEDLDDLLTLEEDDMTLDLDEESEELGLDTEIDLEEPEPLTAEPLDLEEPEPLTAEPLDLEEPEPLAAEPLDLEDASDDAAASTGGIDIEDELPGDLGDLTLDLDSLDVDSFAEANDAPSPEFEPEPEPTAPTDDANELEELDELDELDLEVSDEAEAINLDASELNLEEDDLDLDSLGLDDDTEVAELDLSSLPGEEDDEFEALSADDLGQPVEDDLPELEIDDELSFDDDFDDLGAVEDEMTASPEPGTGDDAQTDTAGHDRSFSLLESIERELTSIRGELSGLKQELAQLRSAPSGPDVATELATTSPQDDAGGGFFEDEADEDETIALTGAELDNIMSTAEFTEETGRPTDLDDLAGIAADEELDLDLIGESSEDHPVQEITLDEAPDDLGTLDIDLSGPADSPEPAAEDANVEALASMDIDAELADIEELEDSSHESATSPEAAVEPPMEAAAFDESEDEIVEDLDVEDEEFILDAEPLDAEPLDAEPEPLAEAAEPFIPDEPRDRTGGEPADEARSADAPIPENLKGELRSVLNYMDKLLDSLPEEKIQEFAASDHFKVYKRLFEELGLEQ